MHPNHVAFVFRGIKHVHTATSALKGFKWRGKALQIAEYQFDAQQVEVVDVVMDDFALFCQRSLASPDLRLSRSTPPPI